MLEQQSLVGRLVNQQLQSIQALRELGSVFADELSRMLHEHNEHIQKCRESQKTRNEARDRFSVVDSLLVIMPCQLSLLMKHSTIDLFSTCSTVLAASCLSCGIYYVQVTFSR